MKSITIRDYEEFGMRWPDVTTIAHRGLEGGPVVITFGRVKRTLGQNAKMWPMLRDISRQVEWNDAYLSEDTWKKMFISAMGEATYVQGIVGDLVQISGTSSLSKERFQDLIELIYAFGSEHEVNWSDEATDAHVRWGVK